MGANAQTTVPTFTAGEVLTAAQQNASARTGVPVFATTTTRDAGFGGTGEKTLAEGQLCYVEGTGLQSYNGSSWVTWGTAPSAGALTLVSATTIGSAVSSVTVSSAFSATYDVYLVTLSGGAASTNNYGTLQLGSTTSGYYRGVQGRLYGGAADGGGENNASSFNSRLVNGSASGLSGLLWLVNPFLAKFTYIMAIHAAAVTDSSTGAYVYGGFLDNTTSYTAFTLTPNTGTWTGGTIRVYGYANN